MNVNWQTNEVEWRYKLTGLPPAFKKPVIAAASLDNQIASHIEEKRRADRRKTQSKLSVCILKLCNKTSHTSILIF